jgi:hypothetical protein
MATTASGGSGGRKDKQPPKKLPDDEPDDHDDDQRAEGDEEDDRKEREYCDVCNAYLRPGQKLKRHLRKYCVGRRGFAGNFECRFPGCGSAYRHYHDLQHHWRDKHPGREQPASMKAYIP